MCIASDEKQPLGPLLHLCSLQTYTGTVSCRVPTPGVVGNGVLRKSVSELGAVERERRVLCYEVSAADNRRWQHRGRELCICLRSCAAWSSFPR